MRIERLSTLFISFPLSVGEVARILRVGSSEIQHLIDHDLLVPTCSCEERSPFALGFFSVYDIAAAEAASRLLELGLPNDQAKPRIEDVLNCIAEEFENSVDFEYPTICHGVFCGRFFYDQRDEPARKERWTEKATLVDVQVLVTTVGAFIEIVERFLREFSIAGKNETFESLLFPKNAIRARCHARPIEQPQDSNSRK